MTQDFEESRDTVTITFDRATSFRNTQKILSTVASRLDSVLLSVHIEEPNIDSAASEPNRTFHGEAGAAIATLLVTNVVALARVLIEVVKNRRIKFEIERSGNRLKYEGPMSSDVEHAIRVLKPTFQPVSSGLTTSLWRT